MREALARSGEGLPAYWVLSGPVTGRPDPSGRAKEGSSARPGHGQSEEASFRVTVTFLRCPSCTTVSTTFWPMLRARI